MYIYLRKKQNVRKRGEIHQREKKRFLTGGENERMRKILSEIKL